MTLESMWTCFSSLRHSSLVTRKCLESLRDVLDNHKWKQNWTEMVKKMYSYFPNIVWFLPFDQNFNVIH